MYAIVSVNGHQHRLEPGQITVIDRLASDLGATVTLRENVLLLDTGDSVEVGSPVVPKAEVDLEVVEHFRGPKVVVFKMKRRQRYRRKHGHRQELTRVRVTDIRLGDQHFQKTPESVAVEPQAAPAEAETAAVTETSAPETA